MGLVRSGAGDMEWGDGMTRKDVIKGLECCLGDTRSYLPNLCTICPYARNSYATHDCSKRLREDSIALLKEQEPRVMTPEEYKALAEKPKEERDPVWEEWPGLESTWEIPNQAYGGYGTSWRCWTSRPTDEQREAIPWN